MNESEFNNFLGHIEAALAHDSRTIDFIDRVSEIISMLDESDQDDYFGSEGWRHRIGWDE